MSNAESNGGMNFCDRSDEIIVSKCWAVMSPTFAKQASTNRQLSTKNRRSPKDEVKSRLALSLFVSSRGISLTTDKRVYLMRIRPVSHIARALVERLAPSPSSFIIHRS